MTDDDRRLSADEVAKVAKLARLRLSAEETDLFSRQLSAILDHAADLAAVDVTGLEPLAHPLGLSNVLRDDVPGPVLDRADVLASAPVVEDGRFRVPPVLGEEG